ncbi:MAG: DUF4832 domain-containing protein [Paludibacter sp.]|nr:DUF4832 domain-containing protein [Paludibacter sp.]
MRILIVVCLQLCFLLPVMAKDLSKNDMSQNDDSDFWNKKKLFKTPEYQITASDSISTIYYKSIEYQGKETEVYAIYCTPGMLFKDKSLDKNLPIVVCVHGGAGIPYRDWIIRWARKGYAAIAMDWRGNGSDKKHLVNGGPEQTPDNIQLHYDRNIKDSWTYQAVSQIILAHSLILSFPEVNPSKSVITGLSWGGFLTSLVSGIDNRFKAAIPVYGCGYIYEHDFWNNNSLKMDKDLYQKWITHFDSSVSLRKTSVPFLFVAGTNDFYYPITIWQKSASLVKNKRQLLKFEMPHATKATFDVEEIYAFANSMVNDSIQLPKFTSVKLKGLLLKAKISSKTRITRAELLYTEDDSEKWYKKKWKHVDLGIKNNSVEAKLPPSYKAVCINVYNVNGYGVSSDVLFNNTKTLSFQTTEIPMSDPAIVNSGTGWHFGCDWGPGANSYDVGARILWRDLEPTRGNYDFTIIENLLKQAESKGGRAIVRFRAVATSGIGMPDYMIELMPKGFMKDWLFNKKPETFAYVPDWNDPDFIERARALLNAIGKKYNNDPRLGVIDIGMYGRWGEWHCAGIKYPTEEGAQEISLENIKAIIDMHIEAFPEKRLVMMTDNILGLKYALSKSEKIGWRRDSYGTDWFQNPERMEIVKDCWKTAPVIAEPIGEFAPGKIEFCKKMEQQAGEFHVATINGINTFIKGLNYSDEEIASVTNAGKNSGFRFAITNLSIPEKLVSGQKFVVSSLWKNNGSTPAYEHWNVIYQIRTHQNGKVVWEGCSSLSLEKLLPTGTNEVVIIDNMFLPKSLNSGIYDFLIIVKDKETNYRMPLALAIRGRQHDGSYKLGAISIQN